MTNLGACASTICKITRPEIKPRTFRVWLQLLNHCAIKINYCLTCLPIFRHSWQLVSRESLLEVAGASMPRRGRAMLSHPLARAAPSAICRIAGPSNASNIIIRPSQKPLQTLNTNTYDPNCITTLPPVTER